MAEHVTIQLAGIVVTAVMATAWLTWFMRDQFSKVNREFYRVISQHNREDDDRFAILDQHVWDIHVRNAIRDGQPPPAYKPIVRRRYLIDDGGDIAPAE